MNILVVPATDWLAGPENRLHRIFHRIAKKHSVHCIHLDTGGNILRNESLVTLHRPRTIRTTNLSLFHSLNIVPQYQLIKRLIRQAQIDIVITTNVFGGSTAIYAARNHKIPSVFDYVDYLPFFVDHSSLPGIMKPPLRAILERFTEYNIRNSDLVLACGLLLAEHARQFNPNVFYIPNGVSIKRFTAHSNGHEVRKRYGLNNGVIGYVGYIQFWTDFHPVLVGFRDTLQEYPDAKLLIVGIGPKFKKLKKLVHRLHLSANVILPGYVQYGMLPKYMSAMDFFILPFEPSFATHAITPLKIHEYAAMGKPVVTTPLYEVTKIYKDAILVAETANEYAKAFLDLLGNPMLRRKKGNAARRIVQERFDWDMLARQYERQLLRIFDARR